MLTRTAPRVPGQLLPNPASTDRSNKPIRLCASPPAVDPWVPSEKSSDRSKLLRPWSAPDRADRKQTGPAWHSYRDSKPARHRPCQCWHDLCYPGKKPCNEYAPAAIPARLATDSRPSRKYASELRPLPREHCARYTACSARSPPALLSANDR